MELNKEERRKDKNNKKKERERKVRKCLDHYTTNDPPKSFTRDSSPSVADNVDMSSQGDHQGRDNKNAEIHENSVEKPPENDEDESFDDESSNYGSDYSSNDSRDEENAVENPNLPAATQIYSSIANQIDPALLGNQSPKHATAPQHGEVEDANLEQKNTKKNEKSTINSEKNVENSTENQSEKKQKTQKTQIAFISSTSARSFASVVASTLAPEEMENSSTTTVNLL